MVSDDSMRRMIKIRPKNDFFIILLTSALLRDGIVDFRLKF